jgi:hypothetical protein
MKHIGLLALALLFTPAVALAQSAQDSQPMPPAGGGGPPGMQQRGQMMQLRMETRSQMLDALSPQHRTLLATVAGQLATSQMPNLQAAARQLDSALSPHEAEAILAAQSALRSQMRGDMQNAPDGSNRPPSSDQAAPHGDAGLALLRAVMAVGGGMPPPRAQ